MGRRRRRPRKRLPIPISTWPLPRKIPCSRTSPCQVVSQPRPPSTSSLLPRVTDGNLLSSASAVPVLLQTFLNCDKSLASHMVPPGLRFKAATTPTVPPACHLALLVQPALIMAVAVLVDKVLVFRRALASVTRLTKLSIPREMLPVVVVIWPTEAPTRPITIVSLSERNGVVRTDLFLGKGTFLMALVIARYPF